MSSPQSPTIQQHSPRIRYEVEGALARLIIDQPQRMNAMALTMWESLPELLARAEQDPNIVCISLEGEGSGPFVRARIFRNSATTGPGPMRWPITTKR